MNLSLKPNKSCMYDYQEPHILDNKKEQENRKLTKGVKVGMMELCKALLHSQVA